MNGNDRRASYDAIYFDSFGVEHVPKEIKKFIANKNIITNIYWIQIYNLLMCEYFRIAFNDFMLEDKSLQDCTTLFSPIIKRMIKWYWNN